MLVVWVVGDSSGKSQRPLYSKLENYPETQDKSPNSILRIRTLQQRSSQAWVRKDGFFLTGEYCEETLLLLIDKLVLEIVSTGDLQLSIKSEIKNIRRINSMEISKQRKSV